MKDTIVPGSLRGDTPEIETALGFRYGRVHGVEGKHLAGLTVETVNEN